MVSTAGAEAGGAPSAASAGRADAAPQVNASPKAGAHAAILRTGKTRLSIDAAYEGTKHTFHFIAYAARIIILASDSAGAILWAHHGTRCL